MFVQSPNCNASCTKDSIDLAFVSKYDKALSDVTQVPERVPVLINYTIGKTVYEKEADASDIALIEKIDSLSLPLTVPTEVLPEIQMTNVGRMKTIKVTHIHNFFLTRQAMAIGLLWHKAIKK